MRRGEQSVGTSAERRPTSYRGKRLLDVVVASSALVVAAPLLVPLAAAVRVALGSPVLFRRERPGLFGRRFVIYKFRTMNSKKGADGKLLPDGDRLTTLGRFLRKTSLDELPELWNVLRGDMSLVGPRPLLFRYLPYFSDRELTRLHARPGITGLAQVSGRNLLPWDERLELDAVYVETMSLRQDLALLGKTVLAVFRSHGAEADTDQVETWLDEERREAGVVPRTVEATPHAQETTGT